MIHSIKLNANAKIYFFLLSLDSILQEQRNQRVINAQYQTNDQYEQRNSLRGLLAANSNNNVIQQQQEQQSKSPFKSNRLRKYFFKQQLDPELSNNVINQQIYNRLASNSQSDARGFSSADNSENGNEEMRYKLVHLKFKMEPRNGSKVLY